MRKIRTYLDLFFKISNFTIIILYLYPGSLIGYFLYGNLEQQPNLIPNPIGTSINHFIFFSYITILALIVRSKAINIFTPKSPSDNVIQGTPVP